MKIDQKALEEAEMLGIEYKTDKHGNFLGVKGPWLTDWYDNYSEMLRENQNARLIAVRKNQGLNEYGQTPAEEKAMKQEKIRTDKIKQKAELAGEMAAQSK